MLCNASYRRKLIWEKHFSPTQMANSGHASLCYTFWSAQGIEMVNYLLRLPEETSCRCVLKLSSNTAFILLCSHLHSQFFLDAHRSALPFMFAEDNIHVTQTQAVVVLRPMPLSGGN